MRERRNKFLKKMDFWLGSPLVYILGNLSRHRNSPPVLQRAGQPHFLLLKTAAIGDTLLVSAIVCELREAYPASRITFVCSKNNQEAAKLLQGVNQVLVFDMVAPLRSLWAVKNLPPVDLLLDFAAWARINSIISWIAPAKYKIGFYTPKMHRHYVYDQAVRHSDAIHELDNFRNLLIAGGLTVHGFTPHFKGTEFYDYFALPYVVFHPFSGGSSKLLKQWPWMDWVELGLLINQNYHLPILISGNADDVEEAYFLQRQLQAHAVPVEVIAGKFSLQDMLSVLAHAEVLVTVDTGIMHLGAAVDAYMVALQGPAAPFRWGPLSKNAEVVTLKFPCQPCLSLGFESTCTRPFCMEAITVKMVWDSVKAQIERRRVYGESTG